MMRRPAALFALVLTALACGDGGSGSSDEASVTVEITTVGEDLDTDGYMLYLDEAESLAVNINDSVVLDEVSPGEHTLSLGYLRSNCERTGLHPLTISVEPGSSNQASMGVECFLRTGMIQVRTFTLGSGGDIDGFVAWIGTIARAIDQNGAVAASVAPGTYDVLLDGLTEACTVEGENPRATSVEADDVVTVTFMVDC